MDGLMKHFSLFLLIASTVFFFTAECFSFPVRLTVTNSLTKKDTLYQLGADIYKWKVPFKGKVSSFPDSIMVTSSSAAIYFFISNKHSSDLTTYGFSIYDHSPKSKFCLGLRHLYGKPNRRTKKRNTQFFKVCLTGRFSTSF